MGLFLSLVGLVVFITLVSAFDDGRREVTNERNIEKIANQNKEKKPRE